MVLALIRSQDVIECHRSQLPSLHLFSRICVILLLCFVIESLQAARTRLYHHLLIIGALAGLPVLQLTRTLRIRYCAVLQVNLYIRRRNLAVLI